MGEGEDAGQVCEGVFANVGRGVCAFGPVIAISRNAMCTLASVADRNVQKYSCKHKADSNSQWNRN